MTEPGYSVERSALDRRAVIAGEQRDNVLQARKVLRAAFDRDRRTLGNDQYGAELEKQLPEIEAGIFDAFDVCIYGQDERAAGLRASAGGYGEADDPGGSGG